MPIDSIKNIERAFTGRCPTVQINNETPINTVIELINYRDIFNKIKPVGATNATLSIAIETFQLISYLPGLFKPHKLPEYDEDLTPLLQRQTEDLEWMGEFNPTTNYALEVTIFESFFANNVWGTWQALARKWLYNQGTEYYLDLINPFLSNVRQSDIGDVDYKLGLAITQKPEQQTARATDNYIRVRCAYSGIVNYEQSNTAIAPKQLQKASGNVDFALNVKQQILFNRLDRKIFYLQNTGQSRLYFNFDLALTNIGSSPYLLPSETLTFESGQFKWSGNGKELLPPLSEILIQDGLWMITDGKTMDGKNSVNNSCAWIEFYG